MLSPFPAYLPTSSEPETGGMVAQRARRIRDGTARYQPDELLQRAVTGGSLRAIADPHLFRYRVTRTTGQEVRALVGTVDISTLRPHEQTYESLVDPAPAVEIRPILVVTEDPLPALRLGTNPARARGREGMHEVTPVIGGHDALEGATLVIADGHHRVRSVERARGPHARILAMVVGDGGAGLSTGTFHRVLRDVPSLGGPVGASFDVIPTTRRLPPPGCILWIHASGERLLLTPEPSLLATIPPPLRSSSTAAANAGLYPALGLADRDDEFFSTPAAALQALGPRDAAVLLAPVSMQSVLDTAAAGLTFPAKATRFLPKPLRGLILRQADA